MPRFSHVAAARGAASLLAVGLLLGLGACGFGPQGSKEKAKPAFIKDLLSPAIPVTRAVRSNLPGTSPGQPSFDAVDFVSPEVGFASAHLGSTASPILWRTTDGGKSWSSFVPKVPGYAQLLLKLAFTSSRDGFAILGTSCTMPGYEPLTCAQMSLVKTRNGGRTFSTVVAPEPTTLNITTNLNALAQAVMTTEAADVKLAGPTSGAAVLPGGLYVESAGSWSKANVAGAPIAAAWGPQAGLLVTETACDGATPSMEACTEKVLRTTDGGATFTTVESITAIPAVARIGMDGSLAVLDWIGKPGPAPCDVGCYQPATLSVDVSKDAGATWTTSTTVKATSESRLGTPVVSAALGAAWLPREHVDPHIPPAADGVLAGGGLFGPDPAWHDVQPQWAVSQITQSRVGGLWAIAYDSAAGTFLGSSADEGSTWQLPRFEVTPQSSVDFVSARVGYGVGAPGLPQALLRTTDGGNTWTMVRPTGIGSASFWTAEDGAVQSGRALAITTDAGATFTPGPTLPSHIQAVNVLATSHGLWVVQDVSGDWWETTDGGLDWARLTNLMAANSYLPVAYALSVNGTLWALKTSYRPSLSLTLSVTSQGTARSRRLWKISHIDASAVGVNGLSASDGWVFVNPAYPNYPGPLFLRLLHTTDGGRTWTEIRFPEGANFSQQMSIDFVNDEDGWMLIPQTGLYRTTDGGTHWTRLP